MTTKLLLGLLSIILLDSCNQKTTSDNKVARCDDFNIVINSPDTIGQDQELFASFHIANSKYKLLWAHYDCNVSDTATVDTIRQRIFGCNKNLIVEHDSVKVWLQTGKKVEQCSFPEVTILAKGLDNKYYYGKCSFDYYVK